MKPYDEYRADYLDMKADEYNDILEACRDIEREETRSRLAKRYGVPIEGIGQYDSGYWTLRTVKSNGPVDTAYPLAGGTMIEKADIIDNKLVRSGAFKRNGKKIFTMNPEQLILDLLEVQYG